MRYLDERKLWYAETEELAERLANKAARDIQEILDAHDVIRLRSTARPKATAFNRVMLVILTIPLLSLCSVKWCFTGNFFLDTWEKKYKVIAWIIKIMGVRK